MSPTLKQEVQALITPTRVVLPEAHTRDPNPPPRAGSLKRKPVTKAEMEERREKLRAFLTKRGEVPVVPEDYMNTLSLKVTGTGEKAFVEFRSGISFARLSGDHLVFQPQTIKALNEDDLEHLQDALVQIRHLLNKARSTK